MSLVLCMPMTGLNTSCSSLGNLTDESNSSYQDDPDNFGNSSTAASQSQAANTKNQNSEAQSQSQLENQSQSTDQANQNQADPENFQPEVPNAPFGDSNQNSESNGTNPQGIPEPPIDPEPMANLEPIAANPQNSSLPVPPQSQVPEPPPVQALPVNPPAGTPTTALNIRDLDPTTALLHWVGYRYEPTSSSIRIEMVTKGNPRFDLFQEKNKKNQHEIVVRFLNTSLRPKIRRDINASEFRSPVAYVRMRPSTENQHVDVVMTLRDPVKPRLFAKNGHMMLTFAIPDYYFGKSALGGSPVAKATLLDGNSLFPDITPGSDAPQSFIVAVPKDPGTEAFADVPPHAGSPVENLPAGPASQPLDSEGLPPSFNTNSQVLPVNAAAGSQGVNGFPTNSSSQSTNFGMNPAANGNLEEANGSNIPANNVSNQNTGLGQDSGQQDLGPAGQNEFGEGQGTESSDGTESPDPENEPFEEDSLKDFDNGDGDSGNTIDKFDVRLQIKNSNTLAFKRFSVFGVAQDSFTGANVNEEPTTEEEGSPPDANFADDSNFSTPGNSSSNLGLPNGNAPTNSAPTPVQGNMNAPISGDSLPPPQPSQSGVQPVSQPQGEPPLAGSPDLSGTETTGLESGSAPVGSQGGKATKLDFRQALLSEVMRVLSEETGTNFVIPVEIGQRRINVSMNDIPANDALKAILDSELLGVVPLAPNLVRVDSLQNIARAREEEERRRLADQRMTPTKILVYRMNYGRATTAMPMLREMLTITAQGDNRVGLQVDERTNSIVVNAPEPALNMAKALLQRIDMETPQVKIASRIVEVFKTTADNLGISWGGPFNLDQGRGLGFGNLVYPNSLLSRYSVDNGGLTDRPVNFRSRIGSINNSMAFDLALSMEESMGTGEVLQSGNLIVEDNQPATIVAGQSDFFRVAGANGGGELREVQYNLNMSVTPHITADGAVQMQIRISSDTPRASAGGDAVTARSNRSLNTTLLRRNGETAVIGGIYNTSYNKSRSGVPILSNLPIIGALFRSSSESDEKRELLVMVTPTIVNAGKQGPAGVGSQGGAENINTNSFNQTGASAQNPQSSQASQSNGAFTNANFGNSGGNNTGLENNSASENNVNLNSQTTNQNANQSQSQNLDE